MDTPLTSHDRALIDREGEKIKSALSKLIKTFPLHAQSITGMALWLNASKTTCQRIIESSLRPSNGVEVIQSLPGPNGLKKFIQLVQSQKGSQQTIKTASEAIIHFESLIHKYARSHSALKQLLIDSRSLLSEKDNSSDLLSRKALFESCSLVTGESMDLSFNIFIHKANDEHPNYLSQYILNYYEGCAMSTNSRPIRFAICPAENNVKINNISAVSKDHKFTGTVPPFSFISDFTSQKILDDLDHMHILSDFVVSPPNKYAEEVGEVAVLKHYPKDLTHPDYGGKMAGLSASEIRFPCKKLYLLVFLENKLAMQSIANPGIYSTALNSKTPEDLWYDRFYNEADVLMSPADSDFNKKLKYHKANELIDSFFSLTNSNKENFYCYALEVDYPIWSTTYRLYFPSSIE